MYLYGLQAWRSLKGRPGLRVAVWSQVEVCRCWFSLWPIGCTPTLWQKCRYSCGMWLVALYKCYAFTFYHLGVGPPLPPIFAFCPPPVPANLSNNLIVLLLFLFNRKFDTLTNAYSVQPTSRYLASCWRSVMISCFVKLWTIHTTHCTSYFLHNPRHHNSIT